MENTFIELSKIDTSEVKEKKGRFDYLSWAVALRELLKKYPKSTFKVHEYNDSPYMATALGFFVKVSVTVEGVEHTQIHPILDNRNMPITKPNAFQVNTSIQRCLAKAIALHGLGLSLFAGEDLAGLDAPSSDTKGTQLSPTRHSTNEEKAPSFSAKPASEKQKASNKTFKEVRHNLVQDSIMMDEKGFNYSSSLVQDGIDKIDKIVEKEKSPTTKYTPKPASEPQKIFLARLNVDFKESITSSEADMLIKKNMNKPPSKKPNSDAEHDEYIQIIANIDSFSGSEEEFTPFMKMIKNQVSSETFLKEIHQAGVLKLSKIKSEKHA